MTAYQEKQAQAEGKLNSVRKAIQEAVVLLGDIVVLCAPGYDYYQPSSRRILSQKMQELIEIRDSLENF